MWVRTLTYRASCPSWVAQSLQSRSCFPLEKSPNLESLETNYEPPPKHEPVAQSQGTPNIALIWPHIPLRLLDRSPEGLLLSRLTKSPEHPSLYLHLHLSLPLDLCIYIYFHLYIFIYIPFKGAHRIFSGRGTKSMTSEPCSASFLANLGLGCSFQAAIQGRV